METSEFKTNLKKNRLSCFRHRTANPAAVHMVPSYDPHGVRDDRLLIRRLQVMTFRNFYVFYRFYWTTTDTILSKIKASHNRCRQRRNNVLLSDILIQWIIYFTMKPNESAKPEYSPLTNTTPSPNLTELFTHFTSNISPLRHLIYSLSSNLTILNLLWTLKNSCQIFITPDNMLVCKDWARFCCFSLIRRLTAGERDWSPDSHSQRVTGYRGIFMLNSSVTWRNSCYNVKRVHNRKSLNRSRSHVYTPVLKPL